MTSKIRTLLFLKSTGVLIGELTAETDKSVLDLSQFFVKDVSFDESKQEYWYGDYHTGEVRSRLDKPIIHESMIKYSTNSKILQKYPIHNQIDIIIDMLAKSNIEKTPEFTELKNFINDEVNKHHEKVQTFSSNPDAYVWISTKHEEDEFAKKTV
jgi:hypothetical protein